MALYRVNKPRHPQANFHVKKNDEVVVLTGTQQGKRGKVLEVLRDRSRVIIEGVNFIKKASRKSQEQPQGGIIEREGALHISKVMLAANYDSRKSATASSGKPVESEAEKPVAHKSAAHKHVASKPAAKKAAPKEKK
jgi:large subunit ribosomal protein L24